MEKRTTMYAHLAKPSELKMGDLLGRGAVIGKAGNTGASDGIHLHIACVEGSIIYIWTLRDMELGKVKADLRELAYFIDDELFGGKPNEYNNIVISTPVADPEYLRDYKKLHLAIDCYGGDLTIYWNRSAKGTVLRTGFDTAYGHFVLVEYEVK